MGAARSFQAALLALASFLPSVASVAASPIHSANGINAHKQSTVNCRQAITQIAIYERPDFNSNIVGTVSSGARLNVLPPSFNDGWTLINAPFDGYVLSTQLQTCGSEEPIIKDGTRPIVEGCGQVVDLGINPNTNTPELLSVRTDLDNLDGDAHDAIVSGASLVLDSSVWRNGRYWVRVLAYPSVAPDRAEPSPTRQAWVAETGSGTPANLQRNRLNILYYPNGGLYPYLNIERRSCEVLFGDLVSEEQPLPLQLPGGFRTP